MTIEYASSRRDIAVAYWQSLRHNRKHLALWLFNVFGIYWGVFLTLRATSSMSSSEARGFAVAAAVVQIVLVSLYPQLKFKPERRVLTITPDGIRTRVGDRAHNYSWRQVLSVLASRTDVYITMRSLNAFVVPLRAFASADQRTDFLTRCQTWHELSR